MKRITKICIPKGKKCEECIALCEGCWCNLFDDYTGTTYNPPDHNFPGECERRKCSQCLKNFPNGAVFELKEKK